MSRGDKILSGVLGGIALIGGIAVCIYTVIVSLQVPGISLRVVIVLIVFGVISLAALIFAGARWIKFLRKTWQKS